jgi:glycosyltransferase involved in cell wall biosynthesis
VDLDGGRVTTDVGIDVSAIPDDPRGAGRYVIELVTALHRRQQVGLHLQARKDDGARWSELAPGADVRAVVPDSRARRLAWEQIAGPRFVDRWGIAVHHGPHYTMPEVAKVPKVVTVHDLTFFDHPEWHEKVKVAVFKRAIRSAAKRADAIVCVSAPTARRLQELLDPQCPVHVTPHGIDHALFRPADGPDDEPADLATLAELGIRPPYVAFWGTLEPRKDVATLVAAFDRLARDHHDLQLAVGGGSGWGNERFEQAVAASPHAGRIVRTGYLADAALPVLARRAEAVVYAAFEEGFGLPAVEALACGASALVTTEGSVMDELTDGAAWLAPAGDADALAGVLDDVLSPATAAERSRRRAHGIRVAATFTWDATAAAHERVYADVAGGASGRR